jgi:hypothetical protein
VRTPSIGEGEFEVLTSAFNRMLAHIESQNDTLRESLHERETAQRRKRSSRSARNCCAPRKSVEPAQD